VLAHLGSALAAITVDVNPVIELGPLSLAWHGLTIALGLVVGSAVALRHARRRGLDPDALLSAIVWLAVAGVVGARIVYLLEQGDILRPGEWLGARGFSFYGGLVFGTAAAAVQLRRSRLDLPYLDAMAVGFPLAMAIGRVGDVINGEHYGPATDAPWGVRNAHPDADVPSGDVAYHSGGLYEIVLAVAVGATVWLLRRHLSRPGQMLWAVVGLYAAGRFAMFFYRVDSPSLVLGLDTTQGISLLLMLVAGLGFAWSSSPAAHRRVRRLAGGAVGLLAVASLVVGCGGDDGGPASADPVIEDSGPIHVHGLGINPADRALFIATHTGLFRAPRNERKAKRVAGRYQDTMAFTVVGPNRFMGSGHPDGREGLPPFLGLIETRDAGESWQAISLQGKADFHVLEVAGRRVYGFGSDFQTRRPRFMVSTDRGNSWQDRGFPEVLTSLAVDPSDATRLVAAGERGSHASRDAGASWRRLRAPSGLLAWPRRDRLYVLDRNGDVSVSNDGGRSWRAVGNVGGSPSAFDSAPGGDLLAARHDGTILQSGNGGATWRTRSTP